MGGFRRPFGDQGRQSLPIPLVQALLGKALYQAVTLVDVQVRDVDRP
ncbi:CRISPR-associated protein Cas5 [Nonomuraea sp. M3C6]|uniref:CRISPR-associated protein Cas5 n=1 Tax=Nonomuraea marmarensis TaxID=3351344 RepID=A0ABW7AUB2_9ACTN